MRLGRGCEHFFNCTRDACEGDSALQESLDGHLVGGIESDAVGSAFFCGLEGQAQAREALEVGLLEVQVAERGHVEGQRGSRALRVGERIQDGQAHVCDGDLRQDRPVHVLHQRMNRGLRMDCNADLRGRHVEEAAGFDDFEALVEHGGRVDGDAAAHHPRGVLESLLRGDAGELVERQLAEWSAGGRQPDGFDLGVRADAQALMDGIVFTVDGQDGNVALTGGRGEDFAGGNHALLVGQADGLAGQNCRVRGFESRNADDSRDHKIRLRQSGACDGAFSSVRDFDASDAGLPEPCGKLSGQLFGGHRDETRMPANGLREGFVDVVSGGQRGYRVAVRKLLDDGKGALADGAGGTENG